MKSPAAIFLSSFYIESGDMYPFLKLRLLRQGESGQGQTAPTYKAAPLEIGFNSRYLLDITEQIVGSEARFLMADAGSPTLVRDGADESALYVLMPMRV